MSDKVYHAVGKRKTSVARVYMRPGTGRITVNGRSIEEYFGRETSQMVIMQPLRLTSNEGAFDCDVNVCGGGLSGQAGAIKHGISRALLLVSGDLRPTLKRAGFLTRDARMVERKKYGRPGARKRFQFSKR